METLVLSSFGLLSLVALVVKKYTNQGTDTANDAINKSETETIETKYKKLQWKFFSAYFLALLGDWLQGPYVYQVNKSLLNSSDGFTNFLYIKPRIYKFFKKLSLFIYSCVK